jgi:hypothetical protein
MSDPITHADLVSLSAQIAHLEGLLREYEDQNSLRNQSLHARIGDLEDLFLRQGRHSFTGQAKVPLLGHVALTLVRDEPS